MKETRRGSHLELAYDSWEEYVSHCDRPCLHSIRAGRETRLDSGRGLTAGRIARDFPEAMATARSGFFPAVPPALSNVASRVAGRVASVLAEDLEYRPDGGAGIDVSAFIEGTPECWISFRQSERTGRACKIVHCITASSGAKIEQLVTKGLAVVSLIRCLELAGIGCEVVMSDSRRWETENPGTSETLVTVKRPEDPLDLPRLYYAIANPDAFRWLGFAYAEGSPDIAPMAAGTGMGSIQYQGLCGSVTHGDVSVPAFDSSNAGAIDVERWIERELSKYGITLKAS